MILAQNISVKIDGKVILDDISCDIQPGVTCVLGPNGAGKSTLLKCLSGGVALSSGQVLFDSNPLSAYSTKYLAQRRAVLGQNLDIAFPFKAIDIVMMGRSPYITSTENKADLDAAEKALQAVEACDLKNRVYATLSGGEKQRVQIARVLAQIDFTQDDLSGKHLFLDEPTAALDIKHQHALKALIKELSQKNLSVFCVVHDINLTCDIADQILCLQKGRLVAVKNTKAQEGIDQALFKSLYDVEPIQLDHQSKQYFVF